MRELKIRATEAEKKVMKQELTITSLQSNRDFQAELAEKNVILLEKERQLRELIRVHDGELERRKEKY